MEEVEQQRKAEETDIGDHVLGAPDHECERAVERESHPGDVAAGLEEHAHRGLQEPRADDGEQQRGPKRLAGLERADGRRALGKGAQVRAAGRAQTVTNISAPTMFPMSPTVTRRA